MFGTKRMYVSRRTELEMLQSLKLSNEVVQNLHPVFKIISHWLHGLMWCNKAMLLPLADSFVLDPGFAQVWDRDVD